MENLVVTRSSIYALGNELYALGNELKRAPYDWELKEMGDMVYILSKDYIKIRYIAAVEPDIFIHINVDDILLTVVLTEDELEYFASCVEYVVKYYNNLKDNEALEQIELKLKEWRR